MVVSIARFRTLSRKWAPLLLWLIVAALAIIGLSHTVEWNEVQGALQGTNPLWLLLAFGTIIATQLLKTWRWRFLLQAQDIAPSFGELVRAQLAGQGLNTFLPIRIGELARIQWFHRYDRVLVLSTITIEKSADLLCFMVMGLALALGTTLPDWLTEQFRAFAISTGIMMGALVTVLLVSREAWVTPILSRIAGIRVLLPYYLRFRNGWRQVTRPRDALLLLGLSGAIWLMAIATNLALFVAFDLPADWLMATVLLVVLQIGITVVALPATIGIFEYLCVLTLGWFAVPDPVAFSVGIVLHLLVLIPSAAGIWFARPQGFVEE